ncbi:N-acetyltransferase 9 [Coemansia sp. RSA 1365]|nr:N-acetyltransferase 9 [Coemansia sp. RSA 1365]
MTGSEPLSIDEEYAMQQSWRKDVDKCTFIVLAKEPPNLPSESTDIYDNSRMIGDVNFYLNNTENQHEAELEVMIAEQSSTGKGIATEVLKLMIDYAVNDIKVTDFVVRIKDNNAPSIHIFEKKLGFEESERSAVFREVTLRRRVDNTFRAAINQWTAYATRVEYAI